MFQKKHYIIGVIIGLSGLSGIAAAKLHESIDEQHQNAQHYLEESDRYLKQSRDTYCSVYLATLSKCMAGKEYYCGMSEELDSEFEEIFTKSAQEECVPMQQDTASGDVMDTIAPPSHDGAPQQNPLFFGDEEIQG